MGDGRGPVSNATASYSFEDEVWPLSGKPYFHVVLSRINVGPSYQLLVPTKLHQKLPGRLVPVVLTYQGNIWETKYNGAHPRYKGFIGSWRAFVDDNNLKVGDALVFELVKDLHSKLVFRVQILRGDIPSELLPKVGETEHVPIIID